MRKAGSPRRSIRRARLAGVVMVIAICTAALSACGGTSTAATGPTATVPADVPTWIPQSVAQYYPGWHYFSKLQQNPYPSYAPPSGPLSYCYNAAFIGNAFQQGVVAELQKLVKQYADAGYAQGTLQVTNANFDPALELSQLNSLVQKGCKVIFGFPASPAALCSGIATANSQGALYVSIDAPVYCDDAINVSWNGYWAEKIGADAVFSALNYKGNIAQTTGIAGVASAVAETAAVNDAAQGHPDIKILGQVNGNWTPSVAHTEMAKFLATHPQKVDGIIDAGAEGVDAEAALLEAGRPAAKVNSITTECAALAFWHQHPEALTLGTNQDPAAAAYEAFLVAQRMLAGQKPMVSTIFYPVPTVTKNNISQWYTSDMTLQSSCIPSASGVRAVPDKYFDVFFTGGAQPKLAPQP